MRLSELIAIGSTVVKPKSGVQFDTESNSGCALGMAVIASGCRYEPCPPGEGTGRTGGVENVFGKWIKRSVVMPCECRYYGWFRFTPRRLPINEIIAHLFDAHVFGDKDWTFDQLLAWVRSVEPEEVRSLPDAVAESEANAEVVTNSQPQAG